MTGKTVDTAAILYTGHGRWGIAQHLRDGVVVDDVLGVWSQRRVDRYEVRPRPHVGKVH